MLRDAVERRQRFEGAHPEVTISVPGTRSGWWIAAIPPGSVPGDPERAKVTAWQLADLMDALDRIWPPDEPETALRADWGARSVR
jgi:hypothetical protein